jgi:hypothetical protein
MGTVSGFRTSQRGPQGNPCSGDDRNKCTLQGLLVAPGDSNPEPADKNLVRTCRLEGLNGSLSSAFASRCHLSFPIISRSFTGDETGDSTGSALSFLCHGVRSGRRGGAAWASLIVPTFGDRSRAGQVSGRR